MRSYLLSSLLLLSSLPSYAAEHKWAWQPQKIYTPFPPEAEPILQEKAERLGPISPLVKVFSSIPEKMSVWPSMEATAIRNSYQSNLFKVEAYFAVQDGLEIGCRQKPGGDNSTEHVPSNNLLCDDHCTHQGRYCPVHLPQELAEKTKHSGKELLHEILRRLCLDQIVKASDFKWFDYLQKFDQSKCFESDDLTQCSRKCLSEAKIDYDAVLAECVKQEELDTDTTNELLEKQLKIWKESPYKLEEMPILEIGGEKFHDHDYFRDDWVLKQWCEKFPPDDQPVSCQYCDTCYRQRRCLWELNCDGGHFDIDTYQIKHHTPSPSSPPTLSPTPAPDKLAANSFLEDSGLALGFGVFIGMVFSGVCFGLAEIRRRKAVAEVAKTLPTEGGFSDEYSFKDEDLELPAVS